MVGRSSSPLRLIDWRTLSPERAAPLFAAETDRWTRDLEWSTAASWTEVERRRQDGTMAGSAVVDERGTVLGWSWYVVRDRVLRVGSFVAPTDPVALRLLDGLMNDASALEIDAITLFAFGEAPGLTPALRTHGLSVDRYWYLGRDLERQPPLRIPDIRRWRNDDLPATISLLERAYGGRDAARPFVPRGLTDDWASYATDLTSGAGCGPLVHDACVCVPAGPNRLAGVALVSRISDTIAHLVQLAVEPQQRGRHIGRYMLDLVCASANQAGLSRMTLFVGGRNSVARSLYESSRFEAITSFVSAGTLQPRRSTSVAPGTAVMTRR